MGFRISVETYETGKTLYGYLKKVNAQGVESDVWDDDAGEWVAGPSIPLAGDDERVTLTAGSGVEASIYSGETNGDLESYTGLVKIFIVDTSLVTDMVVGTETRSIRNGQEFSEVEDTPQHEIAEGLEKNKEQTIAVRVVDLLTGEPSTTTNVTATLHAEPSFSPVWSSASNGAIYSGIPGIYLVTLTAAETNVDNLLISVATYDLTTLDLAQGQMYLSFGNRAIEDDWADGGRLDLIVDAIADDADNLNHTSVPALPSAADVADAVYDEAAADHITAGSTGELLGRLAIFAAGGAGQLTPTLAANLSNLDAAISTRATPAQVNSEVDTALTDIHLDHLFDQDYNPASKPGAAAALLNILIESDSGVPRFTANALETAPSAGGGPTASAVADAVWDEAKADHTAVGSFGELVGLVSSLATAAALTTVEGKVDTVDGVVDGIATTVGALNNLSAADIDARLAAIGLDHLVSAPVTGPDVADNCIVALLASKTGDWSTFVNTTDSLEAITDTGNASWVTGVTAVPTAAQIRDEIDNNSVMLATIDSNLASLYTDWLDGGRLDLILDTAATTGSAAAIRAEIDANSTQLAAILADTNELQADFTDGGRLDLILDEIKTDGDAVLVDTDAIDTTLKPGGTIHTMVNNISATPNTLSAEFVDDSRTWRVKGELDTAPNIVILNEGDVATLAADFSEILNEFTGVASAGGFEVVEGDDGDLTIEAPEVSQDNRRVQAKVSGQLSGKRYKFKVTATTTDAETISARGLLEVP